MNKIDKLFYEFPEFRIIEDWLRKEIQNNSSKHPIIDVYKGYSIQKPRNFDEVINNLKNSSDIMGGLFVRGYSNNYYWGNALFTYLNKIFNNLKKQQGFGRYIKTLKTNPSQFWHTISEMEFNAHFNKNFDVILEPKIYYCEDNIKKYKTLDSQIKFNQRNILFEIFTPSGEKLESEVSNFVSNRTKDKLLDKIDNQIIPIKNSIEGPLVIVINASYSEFDKILVEEALFGQTTTIIGKNQEAYWSRAQNSLKNTRSEASFISAILIFNRKVDWLDGLDIEFDTELILNPDAKFLLIEYEFNILKRFNLKNI